MQNIRLHGSLTWERSIVGRTVRINGWVYEAILEQNIWKSFGIVRLTWKEFEKVSFGSSFKR